MKNSTNTNLLILDETFDSSLDDEGTDNLMKILKTLEKGTNTFIISHKPDVLESKINVIQLICLGLLAVFCVLALFFPPLLNDFFP